MLYCVNVNLGTATGANQHPWGAEEMEKETGNEVSVAQIAYHFSPPQKSPERETAVHLKKTLTDSETLKCPLTCSAERAYIMNVGFQQTVLTMN